MSAWLLDTNVISELMRHRPNPAVIQWLAEREHFACSVITVEEIYCGLSHKDAKRKTLWFDTFLDAKVEVLSVEKTTSAWAGKKRGALMAKGITHHQADLLIAATAWQHDLTLVSRNIRNFTECGIALLNPFTD